MDTLPVKCESLRPDVSESDGKTVHDETNSSTKAGADSDGRQKDTRGNLPRAQRNDTQVQIRTYHHAKRPRCEEDLDGCSENEQEDILPQRRRTATWSATLADVWLVLLQFGYGSEHAEPVEEDGNASHGKDETLSSLGESDVDEVVRSSISDFRSAQNRMRSLRLRGFYRELERDLYTTAGACAGACATSSISEAPVVACGAASTACSSS